MRLATSTFAMFIAFSFLAECAAAQPSPISSDGSANTIVERVVESKPSTDATTTLVEKVIESKSSADAATTGVESQSPATAASEPARSEAPAPTIADTNSPTIADTNSPAAATVAPVAAPAPVAPTTAATPVFQAAVPAAIAAPANRAVRAARKAGGAHKALCRAPRAHIHSASRGTGAAAPRATPPHFAEQPRTEIVSVEPAVRRCNNLSCPKFVLLGVAY